MRIKTELRLTAFICFFLVLVLSLFLFLRFKEAAKELEINLMIEQLNAGIFDLNILTNDYLLNGGERVVRQWHVKYNSLDRQLGVLSGKITNKEERKLLADINGHYTHIGEIFPAVIVSDTGEAKVSDKEESSAFEETKAILASHLLIELRSLSQNILELNDLSHKKLAIFQDRANTTIILCLLIIMGVIWSILFLFIEIVANPIELLRKGAQVIGEGNLDYRVDIKRRDEIGQLSNAFNEMTSKLKYSSGRLSRINRSLMMISQCNQVLIRSANEEDLLRHICQVIVELGDYRMAWVGYAQEDERKTVRPVAWAGCVEGYLEAVKPTWSEENELGRGTIGVAIRTGEPSFNNSILNNPEYHSHKEEALKCNYSSVISLPLTLTLKTIGALNIYSTEKDAFTGDEIALLTELANDLAFGILTIRTRAEKGKIEETLRESESLLRTLIESLPFDIFVINEKGRYILTNSTCRQNWGELIGRRVEEVAVDNKTLFLWQDNNRRAFSGETVKGEVELEIKGEKRFFYNIITPIRLGGKITNIIGVNIDITERKKAELALHEVRENLEIRVQKRTQELARLNVDLHDEITEHRKTEDALRESEERFHRIINTITDYIYTVRIEDGKSVETVHVPSCLAVTGYNAEEFKSDPYLWINIVYEEDRQRVKDWTSSILKGEKVGALEHRIVRKDGSMRWISDAPVFHYDKEGKLIAYNGVVQDITDRKQAEQEKARAEVLTTIIEGVPVAIVITDLEGRINRVNKTMIEKFNPWGNILGLPVIDFVLEKDKAKVKKGIKECLKKGSVRNIEADVLGNHKEVIGVFVDLSVLKDSNSVPIGLIAVISDIS